MKKMEPQKAKDTVKKMEAEDTGKSVDDKVSAESSKSRSIKFGGFDHAEAKPTGPNNELQSFPRYAPENNFSQRQEEAKKQTELLNLYMGGARRRRKRQLQRGGVRPNYGKPGIGSEDSLCGSYQTPEETQFTPDKYIVVPQPPGGSGGALDANDTVINLAKTFTQAKANSEGDWSTPDTKFEDDRQKLGNLKLKGGRRKSRKKRHQGGSLVILEEEKRAQRPKRRRKTRKKKRRGGRRTRRRQRGGKWCKCEDLEKICEKREKQQKRSQESAKKFEERKAKDMNKIIGYRVTVPPRSQRSQRPPLHPEMSEGVLLGGGTRKRKRRRRTRRRRKRQRRKTRRR
jgi:hypothetical protein